MNLNCPECATPLQATATDDVTVIVCSKCSHVVRIPHDGGAHSLEIAPAAPAPTVTAPVLPPEPDTTIDQLDGTHSYVPRNPSEEPSSGIAPGARFGDYELIEEIARGGMGVVYKARQVSLNRVVALKMILAGQLASEADVQRFHTEAEAAANLDHPGIVPIYEVGRHAGQHYFSMGYVEGESLAHVAASGSLAPVAAAELTKKVAEAITYAHSRGVVHRDLKPGNVLLDQTGEPRVTDFGLAKRTSAKDDSAVEGLTATGQILGTPSYMPPEQAAGDPAKIGPAADIYALGAILYCLLTGRPPFRAANVVDTLKQVLEQDPVAPRQLDRAIPADLETICLKCLEKNAGNRYATTADLAEDLARFLRGEPVAARPVTSAERFVRWVARRPAIAAVWGLLLLALMLGSAGGVALWQWREAEEARDGEHRQRQVAERALKSESQLRRERDEAYEQLNRLAYDDKVVLAHHHLASGGRLGLKLLRECDAKYRGFEWHRLKLEFDRTLYPPLDGHTGPVNHVTFSPDGQRLASASEDKTIRLWEALTGKPLGPPLKGHTGAVTHVTYGPDGKRLASASADKTIRVWDALKGTAQGPPLVGHTSPVIQVTFSPDGTRLASAGDRIVRLWDAQTGRAVGPPLKGHVWFVSHVTFSPDGTRLASCASPIIRKVKKSRFVFVDKTVRVWDAQTGKALGPPLEGHTSRVNHVTFSPDGKRLASADDKTIRLWDAQTRQALGVPLPTAANHVTFSPDGTRLASASGFTMRLWDAQTGKVLGLPLEGHTGHVSHMAFSPDGTRLASASWDGTIRLWDAQSRRALTALEGHTESVTYATFSPDGSRLASTSVDNTIRLWDAQTGKALGPPLEGHTSRVNHVTFSPDGKRLASAADDKTVRLWNAQTGKPLAPPLKGHTGRVTHVTFSPDGTRLVSCASEFDPIDNTIRLWNAQTGAALGPPLEGHTDRVYHVTFSPDGKRLASASHDNTLRLWDAQTGAALGPPLKGHTSVVYQVAFSPDGTRLASASADNTVRLWDALTGTSLGPPLDGHASVVSHVTFSPDGKRLASVSWDSTLRLWDARTGKALGPPLEGHTTGSYVTFSPDGKRLASAGDTTVRLWDTQTGKPLGLGLDGQTGSVRQVSFSGDGTRLASAGGGNTVQLWFSTESPVLRVARWRVREMNAVNQAEKRREWLTAALRLGQLVVRFPQDAELVSRWKKAHNFGIDQAEQRGDWVAAIVHINKLLPRSSEDEAVDLLARRAAAAVQIAKARAAVKRSSSTNKSTE